MAENVSNSLPAPLEPTARDKFRYRAGIDHDLQNSRRPPVGVIATNAAMGNISRREQVLTAQNIEITKDIVRAERKAATATMASSLAKSEESLGRLRQQLGDTISVMQGLERRISDLEKGE